MFFIRFPTMCHSIFGRKVLMFWEFQIKLYEITSQNFVILIFVALRTQKSIIFFLFYLF